MHARFCGEKIICVLFVLGTISIHEVGACMSVVFETAFTFLNLTPLRLLVGFLFGLSEMFWIIYIVQCMSNAVQPRGGVWFTRAREQHINNKGVLGRPWTKWTVSIAISSTWKFQSTVKCWKVDFLMSSQIKSAETSREKIRMVSAVLPDTPRPPQCQPELFGGS